jgi:hypothetical protein
MAKKLIVRKTPHTATRADDLDTRSFVAPDSEPPEHGLVGDVVFDPPLTPEERRRRGIGIPIEERMEQARRQIAEALDGV